MSRWKVVLFRGLATMAAVALVEVGLRLYFALVVGPSALFYGTPLNTMDISDPHSAWRENHTVREHENVQSTYSKYHPHQVRVDHDPDTGQTFRVAINGRGFRGKEVEDEKPPGTFRIVTLGASSTFGYYNRDSSTYPVLLEAELRRRCGGSPSIEVINLGIPHLGSAEIVALFVSEALPLQPDLVTFYEGINDSSRAESDRSVLADFLGLRSRTLWGSLVYRSITLGFIDSSLKPFLSLYSRKDVERHMEGRVERFLADMSRLRHECERRGIKLVVASQQAQSQMLSREELRGTTYSAEVEMILRKLQESKITPNEAYMLTHSMLMAGLEEWASNNAVAFVDIIERLDWNRDVLLSWVHLSPEGNRMIADALADASTPFACP